MNSSHVCLCLCLCAGCAGAGSNLGGTNPEFEPSKVKNTSFGASDFLSLMQGGGGDSGGPVDGSAAAKKWRAKTKDGRPISAVGGEGEWAAIDVSSLGGGGFEGEGDFAPGAAWTKPHYTDKGSLRVQFWKVPRKTHLFFFAPCI